jgi:hypothetical protein
MRDDAKHPTEKFSIIYLMRIEGVERESANFSYVVAFEWDFARELRHPTSLKSPTRHG